MACILVSKYLEIATEYAEAQSQMLGVSTKYYNAAYEIVLLQVFDPSIDLLVPFYNAYLTSQSLLVEPPSTVVTAVNRLQAHVLDKARTTTGLRFTNINDWYEASISGTAVTRDAEDVLYDTEPFQVPCEFAKLSEKAGYAVDDGNIDTGAACV